MMINKSQALFVNNLIECAYIPESVYYTDLKHPAQFKSIDFIGKSGFVEF